MDGCVGPMGSCQSQDNGAASFPEIEQDAGDVHRAKVLELFAKHDTDGNGYIDIKDLTKLLETFFDDNDVPVPIILSNNMATVASFAMASADLCLDQRLYPQEFEKFYDMALGSRERIMEFVEQLTVSMSNMTLLNRELSLQATREAFGVGNNVACGDIPGLGSSAEDALMAACVIRTGNIQVRDCSGSDRRLQAPTIVLQ